MIFSVFILHRFGRKLFLFLSDSSQCGKSTSSTDIRYQYKENSTKKVNKIETKHPAKYMSLKIDLMISVQPHDVFLPFALSLLFIIDFFYFFVIFNVSRELWIMQCMICFLEIFPSKFWTKLFFFTEKKKILKWIQLEQKGNFREY